MAILDGGGEVDAGPGGPDASNIIVDEMVSVPAGSFNMGCAPGDTGCFPSESPLHIVNLSAYQIDKTEVTNLAYSRCVADFQCTAPDPSFFPDYDPIENPQWPVAGLNRSMAAGYCAYQGKRLPTEAEWERAARGDGLFLWPWGTTEPGCYDRAQFLDPSPSCETTEEPVDVGSFPTTGVSPFGALDMAGNVWEWVDDYFGTYPGGTVDDPQGPAPSDTGILRGGGFRTGNSRYLRVSDRNPTPVINQASTYGVRCARSVP
jgi:formylglycine-generating enzyme required for sulfatase activity